MFWHLCACLFFSLEDKGEMDLGCTLGLVAGGVSGARLERFPGCAEPV